MNKIDPSIMVGFYLPGANLKPAEISRSLGISPDRSQYTGERRLSPSGREIVANIGLWALEARIEPDVNDLAEYIDQLLSKITFDHEKIATLDGIDEAYIDIFIATKSDPDGGGTCEFDIRPDQIMAISRIGVPLKITVTTVNP